MLKRFRSDGSSRRELLVHLVAFGPIAIVDVAAMFGVRPRFLWITLLVSTFAIRWAHMTTLAGPLDRLRWVQATHAGFALLLIVDYVSCANSRRSSGQGTPSWTACTRATINRPGS